MEVSRNIMLTIFNNLVENNVESLKFLYKDSIGAAVLEKAKNNIDFLNVLNEGNLLKGENLVAFADNLNDIGRPDLFTKLTAGGFSSPKSKNNGKRIQNGYIFEFELNIEKCTNVYFKFDNTFDTWNSISEDKNNNQTYYETKRESRSYWIKIENLQIHKRSLTFMFSFKGVTENVFHETRTVYIPEECWYFKLIGKKNPLLVMMPEPVYIFEDIRTTKDTLDFRSQFCSNSSVPPDDNIKVYANYFMENLYSNLNLLHGQSYSKTLNFFNKIEGLHVFTNYDIYYHADLLECSVDSVKIYPSFDGRMFLLYPPFNLIINLRIASSIEDFTSECIKTSTDVNLLYNIYNPLILDGFVILGAISFPTATRQELNEKRFYFSKEFDTHSMFFLSSDDISDDVGGKKWLESIYEYSCGLCRTWPLKNNFKVFNEIIGLTITFLIGVGSAMFEIKKNVDISELLQIKLHLEKYRIRKIYKDLGNQDFNGINGNHEE